VVLKFPFSLNTLSAVPFPLLYLVGFKQELEDGNLLCMCGLEEEA